MANVLKQTKREQVTALGRLGWSLRRIERETGVHRDTVSKYLRAAGVEVRPSGWSGRRARAPAGSKPAMQLSPDLGAENRPAGSKPATQTSPGPSQAGAPGAEAEPGALGARAATASEVVPVAWPPPPRRHQASVCEPHREFIEQALARGRCGKYIWQDLVDQHGFRHGYASVKRFVRRLRPSDAGREARAVIETAPGLEAQVDYAGDGPLVRDEKTGRYRRARLFCMTLGYSRKSVRLVAWRSSSAAWVELHERAFRALGGVPRLVVLDNLREGVLKPDVYDPALNPLYKALLKHYGAEALACRVGDADRKGKVEADVKSAQRAHRGLRFESLADAQAYYDARAERWDDTRIHGTTKQQVRERFEEERTHLQSLPLEPFRHFRYAERTVHPDGHIEVEAAYYSVPPGMLHQRVHVQWDEMRVRILTAHGVLLREHLRSDKRGRHVTARDDRPRRVPSSTAELLGAATKASPAIGQLCTAIHHRDGEAGVRRVLGVLALAKRHGVARVDEAARTALGFGATTYGFVKRWLDRPNGPALSVRQIDDIIRPLTVYRDLIERHVRPNEGEDQ